MNISKTAEEQEEVLRQQVFVADNHIVINVCVEYNIALSRCNTPEKILSWVWHLTEKTWMTNKVMRRFIELACSENRVHLSNV